MTFHFRQNSMFHFTLYFAQPILHFVFVIWVCTRDSIFLAFIIQLRFMQHLSFAFDIQLFHKQQSSFRIRPSSSVECTFLFSHPTFSICPLSFRFRHPTLGFVLASFRIRHTTFRMELLDGWSATDGDRGLNWLNPFPLKLWSRDFPVEWTRETFSTPDKLDIDRRVHDRVIKAAVDKTMLHLLVKARLEPLSWG